MRYRKALDLYILMICAMITHMQSFAQDWRKRSYPRDLAAYARCAKNWYQE